MGCNWRLLDCREGLTNDTSFGPALTTRTMNEYLPTPFVKKTKRCIQAIKQKIAICFNIHGIQLRQARKAFMTIFNAHRYYSINQWWSSVVKAYSLLQMTETLRSWIQKILGFGKVTGLCINVCSSCFISYRRDPGTLWNKQMMIQIKEILNLIS